MSNPYLATKRSTWVAFPFIDEEEEKEKTDFSYLFDPLDPQTRSQTHLQGLPKQHRVQVWTEWCPSLENTYEVSIPRAKTQVENTQIHQKPPHTLKQSPKVPAADDIKQIDLDLHRTFPTNTQLVANLPLLRQVLHTLLVQSNSKYLQGQNFIAGFLLHACDFKVPQTVPLLHNLCVVKLPGYFSSFVHYKVDVLALESLFLQQLPTLHRHLSSLGFSLSMITPSWMLPLFTSTLPPSTVLRLFDLLFLHTHTTRGLLVSTVLGLLHFLQPALLSLSNDLQHVFDTFTNLSLLEDDAPLFQYIFDHRIYTDDQLQDLSTSSFKENSNKTWIQRATKRAMHSPFRSRKVLKRVESRIELSDM